MMESEVRVEVEIILLLVLVSWTVNMGSFSLIPHYFVITVSTSYSRSSNGEVQYNGA